MGSWSPTCAISNLPIGSKEAVLVVPLMTGFGDPHESNGYTQVDSLWRPVAWPIQGIVSEECPELIRPKVVQPKLWAKTLHHMTGHRLSPAKFLEAVLVDTLKSRHGMWPNARVGCTFIRQDVASFLHLMHPEHKKDSLDFPQLWVDDYTKHRPQEEFRGFSREQRFVQAGDFSHLFSQFHFKLLEGFLDDQVRHEDLPLDDAKGPIAELARLMYTHICMQGLRRHWTPLLTGSNDNKGYEDHRRFLSQMATLAQRLVWEED